MLFPSWLKSRSTPSRDTGGITEALDFNRAYWTAPLTAAGAHDLERQHIEDVLGLEGVVSLTLTASWNYRTIAGAKP